MVRPHYSQLSLGSLVLFGVTTDPDDLMDPELKQVDRLLADGEMVEIAVAALRKRYPQSARRGRRGTPAEVALRLLVLKHLRDWSYERLEWEVKGNVVYRRFCRIDGEAVPDAKTLVRLGQLLNGPHLRALFEKVLVRVMRERKTAGRRLRVDTTVVESEIRYPTDSGMCADGVRVLSRALQKLKGLGVLLSKPVVDVSRSVSRRVSEIAQALRLRGNRTAAAIKKPYRGLLKITARVTRAAVNGLRAIERLRGRARGKSRPVEAELRLFVPRVQQVIRQTRLRVLKGVSNSEGKILSVFDPGARILRRGKLHKPTEFGQLVKVQEAEGGLITDIAVVGTNHDSTLLVDSVRRHQAVFGRPPNLVATDRGFYSGHGVKEIEQLGVKHAAVPKPGGRSRARIRHEQQRWFRRGKAWRTGSEARISRLKHRFGMARSRYRGKSGTERCATWAAIVNNLAFIG